MSSSILVGYATTYGSTKEVAEAITSTLQDSGLTVDLQPLRTVRSISDYGAVVLGAPLIMFRWHKDAVNFLLRHREALIQKPVALFALGPTHNPHDEPEWQSSRDQLSKELAYFPWFTPVAQEMFGGKYDPTQLKFPLKQMAGKAPATDIRDWDAIRAWASSLPEKIK